MPLFRSSLVLLTGLLFGPLISQPAIAWEFTATGQVEAVDRAEALVFDRHDNVMAVGTLQNGVFAAKLHRKHGHELWRFLLDPGVAGGATQRANAVALDQQGHVILAAMTVPAGGGRFTVIKLDNETGLPHWINRIGGGEASAVVVDTAGDVIAAGLLEGNMGIVKLRGADGEVLWRAQPSGGAPGDRAHALALDAAGNAVAAGVLTGAFAVVDLAGSDGSERWRHLISDANAGGALRVAVDRAGDVVALGIVRRVVGDTFTREFTVVKLAGADGTLGWRRDLTGADHPFGDPRGLALDGADDIVVAGTLFDVNFRGREVVVKLAGRDGSEQWLTEDTVASADRVDVNETGDVVVAGVMFGSQRFDIVVRKLSGVSGTQLWRTVRDGAGHGDDRATDVAFDAGGNVAVVGEIVGAMTGADFGVVKLQGGDGADF